jgi:hypothetical protein
MVALIPALKRLRLSRRQFPTAAPAIGAPQRSSAAPPSQLASEPAPAPQLRDWIGVLAMVTGLVMAIMDVQIVTSSLTQIQGGLSASADEIAWVQTAYLIADVVMVPLSGTMSRLLSTRNLFVVATLGFTGASALCATATSLGQNDRLPCAARLLRRCHHAECMASRLHQVPRAAVGHADGDHLDDL